MDWLSIIALVVSVISIVGFIYTIGFRLGQITRSLEYFDPKELGRLTAKVDILWAKYGSSSSPSGSSNNPGNKTETSELLKGVIAKGTGINITYLRLYQSVTLVDKDSKGLERELVPISEISGVTPNTTLWLEAGLEYQGRRIKMLGVYNVDSELKVEADRFEMTEYELSPEEAKSKQLSNKIRQLSLGYIEVLFNTLPSLLEVLLKTK